MELRQRIAELEKTETNLHQKEIAAQEANKYAASIVETEREPLLVLDKDL